MLVQKTDYNHRVTFWHCPFIGSELLSKKKIPNLFTAGTAYSKHLPKVEEEVIPSHLQRWLLWWKHYSVSCSSSGCVLFLNISWCYHHILWYLFTTSHKKNRCFGISEWIIKFWGYPDPNSKKKKPNKQEIACYKKERGRWRDSGRDI